MNKTKTDLQNTMKTQTLDQLMRISIEGPPRKEFDLVIAAKQWLRVKDRRLIKFLSTAPERAN